MRAPVWPQPSHLWWAGSIADLDTIWTIDNNFAARQLTRRALVAPSDTDAGPGTVDRAVAMTGNVAAARSTTAYGTLIAHIDHTGARTRTRGLATGTTDKVTVT